LNKSFYIFLILILFCYEAKTQTNLVYNGDFEIYDTCPTTISSPTSQQLQHCLGWYSPTFATSDYYNACATSIVGVPKNNFGFQYPYSGNAYCGILLQNCTKPGCDGWWMEYLQSRLTTSLVTGKTYDFNCKVVLSTADWDFSFAKFGAYFTSTNISKPTGKPFINVSPQILNSFNNYLTDTLNWINISGSFIANGGEQYITIGFFSDTLNIDTLRNVNPFFDITNYGSYYYIDDVKVKESECLDMFPNIFTPNNDGINDFLKIKNCNLIIKTTIYNRWGNKIFESTDLKISWDGSANNGLPCPDGIYYYIIESEEKTIKGFVQLIR
jgi:gliding motility-associated-like protein